LSKCLPPPCRPLGCSYSSFSHPNSSPHKALRQKKNERLGVSAQEQYKEQPLPYTSLYNSSVAGDTQDPQKQDSLLWLKEYRSWLSVSAYTSPKSHCDQMGVLKLSDIKKS